MKTISSFLITLVVAVAFATSLMGTTYTKNPQYVTVTQWGSYLSAKHTFSGTVGAAASSVDTVLFPFTIKAPSDPRDTILSTFVLHTKPSAYNASGDSTYVTWQIQFSTDNVSWTTAAQIAIDSAATTTAPVPAATSPYVTNRMFVLGPSVFGLGTAFSVPYARIRAVGGNGNGIKNSPANVIQVDILK